MFKDATETPLRVGDYVTAVALPGKLDRTLTLYGFLRLNPDLEFVRRKGRKPGHGSAMRDALIYVALVYVFIGLLLAVSGLPSMLPIGLPESADPRWAVPAAVLTAIPGAILAWLWMRRSETRRRAEIEARNEAARREGRPVEEFAPVVAGRLNRAVLVLAGAFIPVMSTTLRGKSHPRKIVPCENPVGNGPRREGDLGASWTSGGGLCLGYEPVSPSCF